MVQFIKRTIQLKKGYFSRIRRERKTGTNLNRMSTSLMTYGRVLVDFFFSPAVATSSLLAGDWLLLSVNVLLAAGVLYDFAERIYYKEVSIFELVMMAIGLTAAIFIGFSIATPTTLLFGLSLVASTINYIFLVQQLIVPPLKHIVEKLFLYFNKDIREEYFYEPELTLQKDGPLLRVLLGHPFTEKDRPLLASYNKTLHGLCWYYNKYTEELFGNIFRKDEIESIKNDITKLLKKGDAKLPLAFFNTKIGYKQFKVEKLREALQNISNAFMSQNGVQYNQLGAQYFDRWTMVDIDGLEASFHGECNPDGQKIQKGVADLLQDEIARQDRKLQDLCQCLPPPSPPPSPANRSFGL